jgi:uncharacterized protein YeaO (DUF488 family)
MVKLRRAYEPPEADDGYRVLVDRLWPRGISKQSLVIDKWAKEISPSNELRKWFAHQPRRWAEFQMRYRRELSKDSAAEVLDDLIRRARRGDLTLVYSARDEVHNNAVVLRDEIERRLAPSRGATEAHP